MIVTTVLSPKRTRQKCHSVIFHFFWCCFCKKKVRILGGNKIKRYLCTRNYKRYGTVAQLNRASDYGSEGLGFESLRCHKRISQQSWLILLCMYISENHETFLNRVSGSLKLLAVCRQECATHVDPTLRSVRVWWSPLCGKTLTDSIFAHNRVGLKTLCRANYLWVSAERDVCIGRCRNPFRPKVWPLHMYFWCIIVIYVSYEGH